MSKGKAARSKGGRGERATATELREGFPEHGDFIKRGWQARLGDDAPDVYFPEHWIEIKTLKKFNTSPLDQAKEACKGRGEPIAVIRVDRKEPVVMLRWEYYLQLVRELVSRRSADGPDNRWRRWTILRGSN